MIRSAPRATLAAVLRWQAEHPVDDEDVQLALVGWPQGTSARQGLRLLVATVAGAVLGALLGALADVVVLGVVVGAGIGGFVGGAVLSGSDHPTAIVVGSARTLVARGRPDGALDVEQLPAGAITTAELGDGEGLVAAWRSCRVRFGGPAGPVATVDLGLDPAKLRTALRDAGIATTGSLSPTRSTASWLPRAFLVGLVGFLGVVFVVVSVPTALGEGMGTGAGAAGVGIVLLLVAARLRAMFFRTAPRA